MTYLPLREKRKSVKIRVMEYLSCFLFGFLIAAGTYLITGDKVNRLLGGSLSSGLFMAYYSDLNWAIGALCGLAGWLLFILINIILKRFYG
jgi:hypothetical protein